MVIGCYSIEDKCFLSLLKFCALSWVNGIPWGNQRENDGIYVCWVFNRRQEAKSKIYSGITPQLMLPQRLSKPRGAGSLPPSSHHSSHHLLLITLNYSNIGVSCLLKTSKKAAPAPGAQVLGMNQLQPWLLHSFCWCIFVSIYVYIYVFINLYMQDLSHVRGRREKAEKWFYLKGLGRHFSQQG